MRLLAASILVSGLAACAQAELSAPDAAHVDARRTDATPGLPDAPDASDTPDAPDTPDASPPPTGATLLLSEVVLAPTGGEMVEIVNPTAAAVVLSNYYLTDVPSYFRLPAGTQTVDASDFIARFPPGATIAAGAVITVSIPVATDFQTAYGAPPTYAVTGGTMITIGTASATLTNAGEPVVLFYWDGATDVVADCDIVIAGNPSAANLLQDKSAVALDGPDGGTATTAYAADAHTIPTTTAPGSGLSIKRILVETGHETQTGTGNGIAGDDETTEQVGTTWDSTYTAPTPGISPI